MERRAAGHGVRPVTRAGPAIALFDPSGTAHSDNALTGLAQAAAEASIRATVFAPEAASPGDGGAVEWIPASGTNVLSTRAERRDHRATLLRAMREFQPGPDRVFCDLGLDRTLTSRGARIPASRATVFVSHRSRDISQVPKTRRGRTRQARARQVLEELGARDARFVVHTQSVGERLADFVPAEHVVRLGWPVVAASDPCLAPDWEPAVADRTILFPGSVRVEKGVIPLVRCTGAVQGFDRLVVPGRIKSARLRHRLETTDPRVELWDRWLDAGSYRDVMERAALVALPYQERYRDVGTMSSVLFDAMALGRPLLVSHAIEHLLPPGYGGAVITDAGTDDGIASGLHEALGRLEELERAAMTEGRRFVAEHHTYERYLAGLLSAGGAG